MGQTMEQYLDGWQGLRVLVIGEAMLDSYWWGKARRLSPEAPVPVVDFLKQEDVPGGAANVAANLASLGAIPIFLSAIAADPEGIRLKQVLQHHQVAPEFLVVAANRTTLTKQRVISDAQILVRLDQGSTETLDSPTETALCASLEAQFPKCDAVIISDYSYGILTPTVIATLAKLQSQTPRPLIADAKNLAPYRCLGLTAIKPNYEQAIALLNLPKLSSSERLAQIEANGVNLLKVAGVEWAAVTLDVDGAIVLSSAAPGYHLPAQPAPNPQSTGAGDTFIAALTLAIAAGADPEAAARIAATASRLVVQQLGTNTCNFALLRQSLSQNPKILQRNSLGAIVNHHRDRGQQIVFTNGCFDLLHPGHVTYLAQARALGDILLVGVNSDSSVQGLKGPTRPINPLEDRLAVLAALESVTYVIPFDESTPSELIKIVRPDIFAKGGDYTPETLPEAPLVTQLGGVIKILPFIGDRSTTSIIKRIQQLERNPSIP